ncbi:MAG TPA: 5-oxoprolinase subunit PxpB [Bacillales bacterium]
MEGFDFQPLGDGGIRVKFAEGVSPELNQRIRSFCRTLDREKIDGIIEWVPTYETVAIYYSPARIRYKELRERLAVLIQTDDDSSEEAGELISIPTLYGGKAGEDLQKVARENGLSEQEVIDIHSGTDYLIYMMGFLPGFPYLGGMSKNIATSRLETPRERVPAGAVGIAGEQTGIYPLESPGGWNLIGQTPVGLFDQEREQPFLFQAGDWVRFVPVSQQEFEAIRKDIENNRYTVERKAVSS